MAETIEQTIKKQAKKNGMTLEEWEASCKKLATMIPNTGNQTIKGLIKEGKYPDYYPFPGEVIEGKTVRQWYDYHDLVLPTREKSGLIKKVERVPHPKTKVVKTHFENKYYTSIQSGIFNSPKKSVQSPTLLLLYLLLHKAWKNKKDKHNTWDYWYVKKHLIVASRGEEQIAVDLGVSTRTIERWSAALEADGLIIKYVQNRENVYVLGEIKGDNELYLYSGGTTCQMCRVRIGDKVVG